MTRLLYIITRAHEGGAQEHVLTLIRGLHSTWDITLASGEHGYLTEAAAQLGIAVEIVPDLVNPIHPIKDMRALAQISGLIGRVQPDLVHTHSFKAGVLGRLAAWAKGVPAIFTAHGWAFTDGVSVARKLAAVPGEWLMARLSSHVITVSQADYRLGLRYGIADAPKMVKVLNGVDPLPAAPRPARVQPPRIAMVARFEDPKEPGLLLRAMADAPGPFEIWFVGDGALRESAEMEARMLGLADRVRFFGTCRNVPEILAQVDIFVLASRYEGLPMSILEAMRAGLPVVATGVGGVPEAVEDGRTGFLVPRGDASKLRERLLTLTANAELRRRMGAEGRRRFESDFSSKRMVQGTNTIYRNVLRLTEADRSKGEREAETVGASHPGRDKVLE